MLFKASAPGSLMLLGEYAVLHGKHALVCAVDKRMTVTLTPRHDAQVTISSAALGNFSTDISRLVIAAPFQFILATLKTYQKFLPSGCDLVVASEFSDKIGFGSSAAVTVATLAAVTRWLERELTPLDMVRVARKIIRQVQGLGSGADAAACVLGGMVAYKMQPLFAEKLPHQHALTAIYAGYKTPTVEVVKKVKALYTAHPRVYQQIFQAIDACVQQGIQCVREQNWATLGALMNIQQGLMESLGVNTSLLSELIQTLRAETTTLGAKISGSGLGDCVVGLGAAAPLSFADEKIKQIPVAISTRGVVCEKI
jgi:mevalonate kinase